MASLKRISQELGVSHTLVSKVLSGRLGTTRVSSRTKEAILARAKELKYVPNRLAVALKAGRQGAVGIFFHHLGSPGSEVNDRMLKGLAEGLEGTEFRMWLRFFVTDEDFSAACDSRLKSEVDGLIVAGVYHDGIQEKLRELELQKVPVVTFFNDAPVNSYANGVTSVRVCYLTQGYLPTTHLLQSGCRRIACLDTEVQRTDGYRKAHEDAGVPIDARLVLRADNFFRSSGTKAAARLLDEGLEVDGIVCQSDAQANGVINELHLRGVKVPEQVKVTGVDNSPIAENCIVPVTSMTSEVRAAGVKTMELLLKKIQGQDVKPEIIKPRLIQRRSTGAKPRPESEPHELD